MPLNNQKENSVTVALFVVLLGLFVSILFLASVPPVSRDALTHHLFVPKLYLQHGGIYEIPSIPFSYYPMNLDLLYMIPLSFGNDILPKYIHFFFALLTGWLIYNYLKNRTSKLYGLLGTIFFISIPIIVKLSVTTYVDLGLMFFTTAALLLLFRWLNSNYSIRHLLFAGICCGLAAGTKYNGLITIFLLTLFIPILYIRSEKGKKGSNYKSIQYCLLFVLATLASLSPWLIRNYIWTGNPIFPLHDSLFQSNTTKNIEKDLTTQDNTGDTLQKEPNQKNGVFVTRKILYNETWWQALLLPIRFFFEGQDGHPRYFDGKLNPFLFLLPLFAFTRKSKPRSLQLEKSTLLAFSVLFFFFTFFQEALRVRYIVCIVPPLVILSIFGLRNIFAIISQHNDTLTRKGIILFSLAIPSAMLAYNALYLVHQFQIIQPLSYLQRKISREDYITRFYPEYPAIQYANSHLKRDDKVLCIFLGNRGYYMDFMPIFDKPTRGGILSDLLASYPKGNDIKTKLQEQNINYILFRHDLTQNWHQHLNRTEQAIITSFFQNNTEQLFKNKVYSFLRLN